MCQLRKKLFQNKRFWKLYFIFLLLNIFSYYDLSLVSVIDLLFTLVASIGLFFFIFDVPPRYLFFWKFIFVGEIAWNIVYNFGLLTEKRGQEAFPLVVALFVIFLAFVFLYPLFYALYGYAFKGKTLSVV